MAKFSTIFALVIAVAVSARLFAAHDLRELARRQAQEHPGDPVNLPKAPPDLPQRSIEQVARHPQVVLIVEASLSRRGDSYLSSDGQAVLTDDTIATVQLFADRQAVGSTARPGVTVPMILTRWGGEVTFEGVSIRCEDGNDRPIREGGTYLLFLSPSQPPQPGHFEVFGEAAFEIVDGRVSPLFKDGQDVFRRTIDANANDFRRRTRMPFPEHHSLLWFLVASPASLSPGSASGRSTARHARRRRDGRRTGKLPKAGERGAPSHVPAMSPRSSSRHTRSVTTKTSQRTRRMAPSEVVLVRF